MSWWQVLLVCLGLFSAALAVYMVVSSIGF